MKQMKVDRELSYHIAGSLALSLWFAHAQVELPGAAGRGSTAGCLAVGPARGCPTPACSHYLGGRKWEFAVLITITVF